jgi:hypothetical protein
VWRGVVANPFTGQRCPSQTLGGDWRCKCLPVVAQIDSDIVSGRCSGIYLDYEEDVDVGVLATSRVALAILAGEYRCSHSVHLYIIRRAAERIGWTGDIGHVSSIIANNSGTSGSDRRNTESK